ncbi:TonB-dependent receptor plug domain-containing protein [Mucilaginibacter boryungensis]|uniref:TonB-dependent receptor n=1 Tax=Mucilaginibacter boryungensis TaxID=768480 RepID=A0ABR9XL16_9SPHI|nr:TonB-dependent receptor [Mucilaginibacter boryungensis]MBE9667940.1 TonB-dependent receptor [Mucilaginibacter boryungensis]
MKMNFSRTFCFSFLLLLVYTTGYGQHDTTKLEDLSLKGLLDVKVVTASKTSQNSGTAPATVTVVSKDQIRTRGYQSLLDLIVDLPDMKLDDKIYPGSGNSITVRGIQGQQNFVILLDGVKISSPTNEAIPVMENYPVNLAEQVEVMYGPASALYGADAVSGVINIITKKLPAGKNITVDANAMAGTYGYINNTLFLAKKLGTNASLTVSGQYNYNAQPDYTKIYPNDPQLSITPLQTGTFNTVYGVIKPVAPVTPAYQAPTSAYNIYAALSLDGFTFSVFSNYTRTPSAYSNNTNNTVYNKNVFLGQHVTTANAAYKKVFNRFVSSSSLTASNYTLDPESNYRNMFTSMEPVYKYSVSTNVKAEQQLDYKASDKLNLTAGVSYESFNSIPQSADLDQPVNTKGNIEGSYAGTESYYRPEGLPAKFYNINYFNLGNYLQAQFTPLKQLSFTLGARHDYNSRYGSSFTPRLGMVYKPLPATTVKLLYGSAYLAPAPSDSYIQYGSFTTTDSGRTFRSSFLHLPNPDLKPIRAHNFELNVRQYLTDNFTITADGYFAVSTGLHTTADDNESTRLYHNTFDGMPVDYAEVFINQGRQENYGGSLQFNLKHSIGDVFLNSYASLSYVGGETDDPKTENQEGHYDAELPFISPWMFRIGTDMQAGRFTFSPRLLLMGRQNLPSARDTVGSDIHFQTISGYALLNLSARYTFGKRFSVFINVSNALNQHYRSVSYLMDLTKKDTELFYGQPEDPIRIMGGLNFHF